MKRSLNTSGATSADCSVVDLARPAASNSALGRALTSGRRLRATQPARPWPARTVMVPIASASTPVAKRQRSVSASSSNRNSAHAENGTRFDSFDEISAIVSATPRLVPIVCAIS